MSLPVSIENGDGTVAHVTKNGELAIAPILPNITAHHNMTLIDTAYNFAPPVKGQELRLQNILMYANKTVGVNDASIVIYTTTEADSLTISETVLELELPKYASRDLIGLNISLPEGVYLNAKTNDATVFMTMMGYYLDV